MSDAVQVALVTSAATLIGSVMSILLWQRLQAKAQNRLALVEETKAPATVNEANTRANIALVGPLTERLTAVERELASEQSKRRGLEQRVSTLEKEREEWQIGIGLLMAQIAEMNEVPTWTPAID